MSGAEFKQQDEIVFGVSQRSSPLHMKSYPTHQTPQERGSSVVYIFNECDTRQVFCYP